MTVNTLKARPSNPEQKPICINLHFVTENYSFNRGHSRPVHSSVAPTYDESYEWRKTRGKVHEGRRIDSCVMPRGGVTRRW